MSKKAHQKNVVLIPMYKLTQYSFNLVHEDSVHMRMSLLLHQKVVFCLSFIACFAHFHSFVATIPPCPDVVISPDFLQ